MPMKRILVICPFPFNVAAGQRLKYEQYLDQWGESGYDITMSPFLDDETWKIIYKQGNYRAKVLGTLRGYLRRIRDLFCISHYDIVYVFLWVTPSDFFLRRIVQVVC